MRKERERERELTFTKNAHLEKYDCKADFHFTFTGLSVNRLSEPWSSLVEGDEGSNLPKISNKSGNYLL